MSYQKTNWENSKTPINETNLNHIEQGIKEIDDRVTEIEENNPIYFTEEEEWEE